MIRWESARPLQPRWNCRSQTGRGLAVPVAPPDTIEQLRAEADDVVCLLTPEPFYSVSWYYDDFTQTSDAEVVALLHEAQTWSREAAQ